MTQIAGLNVSRETFERLSDLAALVEKWTQKINLISKSSVSDLWDRHIVDSVQVYAAAPVFQTWVDIGSGGGFPGIVVGVLAAEFHPKAQVTLVESDQRKCAFLRSAIRELSLSATVQSKRIETLPPFGADVLSARALADLDALLAYAEHHLSPTGIALFPKGEHWKKEYQTAQQRWSYRCEAITSITNPAAAVLKIEEIRRV